MRRTKRTLFVVSHVLSFTSVPAKGSVVLFLGSGGSSNARVVSSFSGQFLEKGTFTGF